MGKYIDISGMKFGYWTVLHKSNNKNSCGHIMWVCRCKCGNVKEVSGSSLRTGASKSCGCLQIESVSTDLSGKKNRHVNSY